jgi:hypothetical protein
LTGVVTTDCLNQRTNERTNTVGPQLTEKTLEQANRLGIHGDQGVGVAPNERRTPMVGRGNFKEVRIWSQDAQGQAFVVIMS